MGAEGTKNLEAFLKKFGKSVVRNSRRRLKKEKGNTNLSKSIKYKVEEKKGNLNVTFSMDKYGPFLDKGVKGKNPSNISPNAKIKGQQAPKSPYKFGSGTKRGTFKQFVKKMAVFAQKKNIRFRQGKTGKFAKGNYQSIGYIIASNIYNRGLKPTMFFSKPFGQAMKTYAKKASEAIAKDIEESLRGKKK